MSQPIYAERKTALTPQEKLRVAVAHLCEGVDQHVLAALMGVNQGRINEAVTAVRRAIEDMGGMNSDALGPR